MSARSSIKTSRSDSRRSSVSHAPLRLRRGPPVLPNDPFANCDWSYVFIETPLGRSSNDEFSFYLSQFSDLASRSHFSRDRGRIRLVSGRSLPFVRDTESRELGPDSHAIMVPDAIPGTDLSPVSVRICSGGDTSQYETPSVYNFVPRFLAEVNHGVQRKTCWQFVLKFKFESVDPGVKIVPATRKFTKTSPINETSAWMDSVQVHIKHDEGDFAIAAAFQFVNPENGLSKMSGYHFVQPHLFRIGMVMKDDDVWDAERSILKSVYNIHMRPCLAPAPFPPGIRAQYIDPNETAAFQEWQLGQNRLQLRRRIDTQSAHGAQPDRQLVKALEALDTLVNPDGSMRRVPVSRVSQEGNRQNETAVQGSQQANSFTSINLDWGAQHNLSGRGNPDLFTQVIIPSPEEIERAGCLDPSLLHLPGGSMYGGAEAPPPNSFDWEDMINWDLAADNVDWYVPSDSMDMDVTMNEAATHVISELCLPQITSTEDQQLYDFFCDTNAAATVSTTASNPNLPFDSRSFFEEAMAGMGQQEDLPGFTSTLNDEPMDFMTGAAMEWAAQDAQSPAYHYPDPETPTHSVFSPFKNPTTAPTTMPSSRPEKRAADSESPSDRVGRNKRAKTSAGPTAGADSLTLAVGLNEAGTLGAAQLSQTLEPTSFAQIIPSAAPASAPAMTSTVSPPSIAGVNQAEVPTSPLQPHDTEWNP